MLPGDIVTALNGLPLASDGTMKDYCDVLRTSGPDKPIEIEVLRYDTQEVLRGELYSDSQIEPVFSFAEEVGDVDTVDGSGLLGLPDAGRRHRPDHGRRAERVDRHRHRAARARRRDARTRSSRLRPISPRSTARGTRRACSTRRWRTPTDIAGTIALVAPAADQCTTDNGVTDYDDGVFTGQYQYWSGCGASGAGYVVLVANPGDASYTAVIAVQILTDADWEALDQAFATFNVVTE